MYCCRYQRKEKQTKEKRFREMEDRAANIIVMDQKGECKMIPILNSTRTDIIISDFVELKRKEDKDFDFTKFADNLFDMLFRYPSISEIMVLIEDALKKETPDIYIDSVENDEEVTVLCANVSNTAPPENKKNGGIAMIYSKSYYDTSIAFVPDHKKLDKKGRYIGRKVVNRIN